jgi:mevalonate pyrophosphate decarboxylase
VRNLQEDDVPLDERGLDAEAREASEEEARSCFDDFIAWLNESLPPAQMGRFSLSSSHAFSAAVLSHFAAATIAAMCDAALRDPAQLMGC